MKIKVTVDTRKWGSDVSEEIEVPDDLSEIEIDEAAFDMAVDLINYYWEKVEEE